MGTKGEYILNAVELADGRIVVAYYYLNISCNVKLLGDLTHEDSVCTKEYGRLSGPRLE